MSVWLTTPSARPAAEAQKWIDTWRARGYKVAVVRDHGRDVEADFFDCISPYPGYAVACNVLIRNVMDHDPAARWFICAGDDITPDETKSPQEIALELESHFGGTFGVMQPTGDPWADAQGRMIERIAGSPWIGREFCLRTYGGYGPYCNQYTHCFVDNEIMEVAKLANCFLQRPDLTHYHHHWSRERRQMPVYLRAANSQQHWQKYMRIYQQRRAAGFPGALAS